MKGAAVPSRNVEIAQNAEAVARTAGVAGVVSWVWETMYALFGWATSGHFLATASVLVAIVSSLIGLYYRRQEAQRAARRERREEELHAAQLRKLQVEIARHQGSHDG